LLAICLTLAVLCFWWLAGWGLMAALRAPINRLQQALIAPAVGIVVTLLPLFFINRGGVPINRFGVALAVVLTITGLVVLFRAKRRFPWRSIAPFAVAVVVGLVLTARPMLRFGFDWLSFCNDDMANYCLAADRFLKTGFFNPPTHSDLEQGYDYAQIFWFMHVPSKNRAGSELLLAFVSDVSRLNAHRIFMPTIVAMHLAQVLAAAGLVCARPGLRRAAVATAWLVALSALMTFGTLYQLIAQVGGMGTLIACAAVVMRPMQHLPWRGRASLGVLAGVLVAGQIALYPEVCPFLGVAFAVYVAIGIVRRKLALWPTVATLAIGAALVAVALNVFAYNALMFLLNQARGGFLPDDPTTTLFPFYLVPAGLAHLWGLLGIAMPVMEPTLSIMILIGLTFTLVAAYAAVRAAWRGHPAGAFAVVMVMMSFSLYFNRAGFGLYKLAMYAQPFLLGSLVVWWFATAKRPIARVLPLVVVAVLGLRAQNRYVNASVGDGSTFIEVPDASATAVNREFAAKLEEATKEADGRSPAATLRPAYVISDTYNIVLAKFEAMYTRGRQAVFPSNALDRLVTYPLPGGYVPAGVMDLTDQLIKGIRSHLDVNYLQLRPGTGRAGRANRFVVNGQYRITPPLADDQVLVRTSSRIGLFNRRRNWFENGDNFRVEPAKDVRNYLLFIESNRGRNYYLSGGLNVSMYQLERDPIFFTDLSMSGVGRHLMVQVLNPTPTVRVVMEVTASYKADAANELPPAAIVGAERVPLGLVGRGSARMVSPPIKPLVVDGRAYVEIDMGREGQLFPTYKTGMMKLYGTDVVSDRRRLTGFARDISVLSEEEFQALAGVQNISRFGFGPPGSTHAGPNDLRNPNLVYSGAYEDGWLSDASSYLLSPTGATTLSVRAEVPDIGDPSFKTTATLLVDGKVVAQRLVPCGRFELTAPVTTSDATTRHTVELRFDRTQSLKFPDSRPVTALLHFIGFESPAGVARGN
jgi:hypothetical protein